MGGFESFIALRYLKSKRKEVFISIITVISVLAVAISVMVLDIMLSIFNGFEKELQAKLIDANYHVLVRQYGGDMTGWQDVAGKIEHVPGVVAVYPYTYNQALLSTPAGSNGIIIRGLANLPEPRKKLTHMLDKDVNIERLFSPQPINIERPDGTSDEIILPGLLVGRALKRSTGILDGEPVTLFSPQLTSGPQGMIPKFKRFIPVGTYSSGLQEYESGIAYAALPEAQKLFGLGDGVTGLEISVEDLSRAGEISHAIMKQLGEESSPYYVTDWTQANKPLWDAMNMEKRVYFIVLLLLILIASFTIVSTLVMVVMEKSADIAILKSMGAADRSVMKIFLMQGAIIGVSGTILGTLFGYLGAIALRKYGFPIDPRVFNLSQVPVHIDPLNFLMVAFAGFIITSLAGIYPAMRAARLNPAAVLRFE